MNKHTNDPKEIAASLFSAAALFGDTFDRLEEIEATLESAIAQAGGDDISIQNMALIARAAARLARDGMSSLGDAQQRFSLEAERYGNDQ